MPWALIIEGVVWEITDIDPSGRFHPSLVWVECPPGTVCGMLYENGVFSPAPLETQD